MVTYQGQQMRDYISQELSADPALDPVVHDDFLVYIMGPYTTHDLSYYISSQDTDLEDPREALRDDYNIDIGVFDHDQSMYDILEGARDYLRDDRHVNAFIATDPNIPHEEDDYEDRNIPTSRDILDTIEQSKRYSTAADCILFLLPFGGVRDGANFELGIILERLSHLDTCDTNRCRVLYEDGVNSTTVHDGETHYDISYRPFNTFNEFRTGLRQLTSDVFTKHRQGQFTDQP